MRARRQSATLNVDRAIGWPYPTVVGADGRRSDRMQRDDMPLEKRPVELPSPGKEPRETFLRAVVALRELLKSSAVKVRVGRSARAELLLDEKAFAQAPAELFPDDLPRDLFLRLLRTELECLVNVALESEEDDGVRMHFPPRIAKEMGRGEIEWRLEQVREAVPAGDLRDRVRLRRTARGPIWEDLTWQVCLKQCDEIEGPMGGIPFAVISLSYSDPIAGEQALVIEEKGTAVSLPISTATTRTLTVEVHEADLQYMIEKLTVARDNLAGIRKRP